MLILAGILIYAMLVLYLLSNAVGLVWLLLLHIIGILALVGLGAIFWRESVKEDYED